MQWTRVSTKSGNDHQQTSMLFRPTISVHIRDVHMSAFPWLPYSHIDHIVASNMHIYGVFQCFSCVYYASSSSGTPSHSLQFHQKKRSPRAVEKRTSPSRGIPENPSWQGTYFTSTSANAASGISSNTCLSSHQTWNESAKKLET